MVGLLLFILFWGYLLNIVKYFSEDEEMWLKVVRLIGIFVVPLLGAIVGFINESKE